MTEIPTQLIATIHSLSLRSPISKEDKTFIKDNLIFLQDLVDENESETINLVTTSLSKNKLSREDKSNLLQNKKHLIEIVDRYKEQFDTESSEDQELIKIIKSVDDIEQELDDKVDKYVGYDKCHPMLGVTFDKTKNKYQMKHEKINTSSTDITIACNKIKKFFDVKFFGKIEKKYVKKSFSYNDRKFMTYWHKTEPFFDIQHIISILDLKTTSRAEKYNEFSKQITNYTWHQNEFGGYVLRELIPRSKVFEIILSSNSAISKSFKKDVSKILDELSKDGDLIITNNAIVVHKQKKSANLDEDKDRQIQNMIIKKCALSYGDSCDMNHLYIFVNQMSYQPIIPYVHRSVLYAFVVPLQRDHNNVIVKFGWSHDIFDRINKLQTEFGSNFYLIGIKCVKNETVEKQFHSTLRHRFPDNIEPVKIKNKDKTELYKLNLMMMTEFGEVEEDHVPTILDIHLTHEQKSLVDFVRNQNIAFQNAIMSQLNYNYVMSRMTDSAMADNYATSHYGFLALQWRGIHEQTMTRLQQDFELKKMEIAREIQANELRLRIKDLEFENYKLRKGK